MGKAAKAVTKAVTKTVKKAVKVATSPIKGTIGAATSLLSGDIDGAAKNLVKSASYGAVDLTGSGDGLINSGKIKNASDPINAQNDYDQLLAYISDLRDRKARRNRSSTNNTDGANTSTDYNKLSGTTLLG